MPNQQRKGRTRTSLVIDEWLLRLVDDEVARRTITGETVDRSRLIAQALTDYFLERSISVENLRAEAAARKTDTPPEEQEEK